MIFLFVHLKLPACRFIPQLGFWTYSLDLWLTGTVSALNTCSSLPNCVTVLHGIAEPICLLTFKGIFAELLKAAEMKNNQTTSEQGLLLLDKTCMSWCLCFEFRPPLRKMATKASFGDEQGFCLCMLFTYTSQAP